MHALLGAQDAWDVVENGHEKPPSTTTMTTNQLNALKESLMKDKTALYLLFEVADESGFQKIASAATSKEA